MKWLYSFFAVVVFALLTGCATLTQSDQNLLQSHHVSASLYSRMLRYDPLALEDIIELSQRHVPSSFIVHYLYQTNAAFYISKSDAAYLRKEGVSKDVIDVLRASNPTYGSSAYPVYPAYPYSPWGGYPYGYAPYAYGPTVIIGGGYSGGYHGGGYGGYHGGGYGGGYNHWH